MRPLVDKLMKVESKLAEIYEQYQEIKKSEGVVNAHKFMEKNHLDTLLAVRSNIEKYLDDIINLIEK